MNSQSKDPLLSIITVVYNGQDEIEQTIKSVLSQSFTQFEYIIIDGQSSDNTVELIKKYESNLIYWVSEKDDGIYDAMNKGIHQAKGQWVHFLNCGDYFKNHRVLESIFSSKYENNDIIYGQVEVRYPNKLINRIPGKLRNIPKGMIFSHQSTIVKNEIMKKCPFRTDLKIASDFDFFYKCFIKGLSFKYLPICIASVSSGGVSDIKRISSILERWEIIGKRSLLLNIYYLRIIFVEYLKIFIKKMVRR